MINNLSLTKTNSSAHPDFIRCLELYHQAFPPDERRPTDALTALLAQQAFSFYTISLNKNLAGFITCWNFSQFAFIEHFAIFPEMRSAGTGSLALQKILHKQTLPVILEVELPDSTEAVKRIRFYKKNGFHILSKQYIQPAYSREKKPVEAWLMGNQQLSSLQLYNFVKHLHTEVYPFI